MSGRKERRAGGDTKRTVLICRGTGCQSSKSDQIQDILTREVAQLGLSDKVNVKFTGCHGFCQRGPILVIEPDDIFYTQVKVEDAPEIARLTLKENRVIEKLLFQDPATQKVISRYSEIPFYNKQQRVILHNCGHINPENIQDYIDAGGYQALKKALLEMTPDQVIAAVKQAGLRGRGGAGFPTAQKWQLCRNSVDTQKYIVCNADEGDPGAFMDRSILEADPHAVLEGMTIGGYAIGATQGYVYCRAEKPLAIKRIRTALKEARERGMIGEHVLGSNFSFDITVKEGAGAFVCGEETALMASIEGKRGMPRARPPFPAQAGLWGKPTNINNVKTMATIPIILTRGADWFSSIGTKQSPGTAVFALTGKIANRGLVEVPMGTTLRQIIFDIGGGIPEGKKFKAAQTGGPSGGCLPADYLDLPVDYESLTKAGSIMGSGGLVIMDEATCMVDVARFFLAFTQRESCGKCVPCRLGTKQMLGILEDITLGKGKPGDIELLLKIGDVVRVASLCGLGRTAPNPVATSIRYFRSEYEAHIKEHRCPAGVCQKLAKG